MKVLLVADVGGNEAGYYHVGDEAMLLATSQWYRSVHPDIELGLVSRSLSHQNEVDHEFLHLLFPAAPWAARRYFVKLLFKTLVWKFLNWHWWSATEATFINQLATYSVIHFTGGGNIYSHHLSWLAYVWWLIGFAKLTGQKVILTSQTLGPFSVVDAVVSVIWLSTVDLLILREPESRHANLFLRCLKRKVVYGYLDAAYFLPISQKLKILPARRKLRIGLSLHEWSGYSQKIITTVTAALSELSQKQPIEVVLIPHILTNAPLEWDRGFMRQLTKHWPKKITIIAPTLAELAQSRVSLAVAIKALTREVDMLIASRYHGVIFGLSQSIPTLALGFGTYYQQKNRAALELTYDAVSKNYLIDLDRKKSSAELLKKTKKILKNLGTEKKRLEQRNRQLKNNNQVFNNVALNRLLKS
jgi:polysaccharide pyruvyl transferase WcaK-like protein